MGGHNKNFFFAWPNDDENHKNWKNCVIQMINLFFLKIFAKGGLKAIIHQFTQKTLQNTIVTDVRENSIKNEIVIS